MLDEPTPKLCECGCGQPTRLASKTNTKRGWIKGQPIRFLQGHMGGLPQVPWSAALYTVEDRGYETPCWIWAKFIDDLGYGKCRYKGKLRPAHRRAWEHFNGPIPRGLEPDHLCRVRSCVNPSHLDLVTHAENCRRSSATKLTGAEVLEIRRRSARGETRAALGREYGVSETNIRFIATGRSWRE